MCVTAYGCRVCNCILTRAPTCAHSRSARHSWHSQSHPTCVLRSLTCVLRSLTCVLRSLTCALRSLTCVLRSVTCALRSVTCVLRSVTCVLRSLTCALRRLFGKRSLGVHTGARLPVAPASGAPGEHRFSENVHSECTFLRKDTDPVCVDLLDDNLGLEFPKSPPKRGFPDRKMRSGVFTPKSYTFWCESHLQCVTLAVNVAHKSKRRARLPLFGSHLLCIHSCGCRKSENVHSYARQKSSSRSGRSSEAVYQKTGRRSHGVNTFRFTVSKPPQRYPLRFMQRNRGGPPQVPRCRNSTPRPASRRLALGAATPR